MLESIISLIFGGVLGKIRNFVTPKSTPDFSTLLNQSTEPNQMPQEADAPSAKPDVWQSSSPWANVANFIVMTTRSIIAYIFVLLMIFIVGYVIFAKDGVSEQEIAIFNIVLTNLIPSIIGYWFIKIDGLSVTINSIKKYFKK